jgi:hypothetical protein
MKKFEKMREKKLSDNENQTQHWKGDARQTDWPLLLCHYFFYLWFEVHFFYQGLGVWRFVCEFIRLDGRIWKNWVLGKEFRIVWNIKHAVKRETFTILLSSIKQLYLWHCPSINPSVEETSRNMVYQGAQIYIWKTWGIIGHRRQCFAGLCNISNFVQKG